jgi:hypothetical protein
MLFGMSDGFCWLRACAANSSTCSDALLVVGADNMGQTLRDCMGLYARVPNVTQGGRPVYRNVKANYLYFWPASGQWGIGSDYASDPIGARSSGSAPALCPHVAAGWQVFYNGEWVRPSSASSDLAFVGADAWRRCVRSGWRCVSRFVW